MVADVVEAGREGVDDPDRAPVAHHENLFAGVARHDLVDEAPDPGPERLELLGVVRARTDSFPPAPLLFGKGGLDLLGGPALPRAEAALTEARVESNLEAKTLGDDLSGLSRAGEVARVERVDRLELLSEAARLLAAGLVQRSVRVALPAVLRVPVRLAVAQRISVVTPGNVARWTSGSAGASVW